MTKAQALQFFGRLQKLMKQSNVSSIESRDGRIIFFDANGKSMCSFEQLDISSENMQDCMIDPGWRDL